VSADNKLNQAGLDNWLNTPFCPAVETAIDRIKVPNNWVTDLSEGRQTSLNTKNDLREWIKDRVEEAEEILEKKDIELESVKFKPGMDFDDPINKLNSSDIQLQSGFRQAYKSILAQDSSNVLSPVIISGRGDNFLTHAIKDVVGLDNVDWAGENGCIYHDSGKVYVFDGEKYQSIGDPRLDYSKKITFDREVWRKAAEEDRKIIWASSFSPVSGTLSIEGEGINLEDDRTGIRSHRFYGNEYVINSDTERIWKSIESAAEARDEEHGFERENPMIIFNDTRKNAEILSLALNMFSPGAELRFTEYKGKIAFYPCPEADESCGSSERQNFMGSVVEKVNSQIEDSFELEHHSDGWTDYMTSQISKQSTAEAILGREEDVEDPKKDALMTYIGDRVIDVFDAENALFFAQIGRPSKNYCEEHDIDHVAVNNATDYCLVISELIHRNKDI